MKLKIVYILSAITALFQSCAPTTVITGTWKSPAQPQKKQERILVAALTSNTIAKEIVENEMAMALGNKINVLKSILEFPPDISNSDTDRVSIMNKVKDKNIDAILTISLLNKETESRYIPGRYPYEPLYLYGYYDNFWGYYSYWYPYMFNQGYYVQEKIYFIETNLYDVRTEKLIWSAQSKTYDPADLKKFSKEFAALIAAQLKKDGILNGTPQA